jgi:methyl coenzyme M reductase gamma subunit
VKPSTTKVITIVTTTRPGKHYRTLHPPIE